VAGRGSPIGAPHIGCWRSSLAERSTAADRSSSHRVLEELSSREEHCCKAEETGARGD
jgi:hypothetical protein